MTDILQSVCFEQPEKHPAVRLFDQPEKHKFLQAMRKACCPFVFTPAEQTMN